MIQEKLVQDFIEKQTEGWLEEDVPVMQQKFPANQNQITESLSAVISKLCRQASRQQQTGSKGSAAYLCISFLRTNILDDRWQYRLDIYDEKFYLDRTECTGCWEIDFVWDYLKARLVQLNKAVRSGMYVNRVHPGNLSPVKLAMAQQYHQIAMVCTKLIIEEAITTPEYTRLRKVPNFKITMGEYLDKSMLLYEEQPEIQAMSNSKKE